MKRVPVVLICVGIIFAGTFVSAQKAEEKKPVAKARNLPDGYGGLKWGTSLSSAKNSVAGKITYTDEKKRITTKDGDIEYIYGFFYRDVPAASSAEKGKTEKATAAAAEGKLFYVVMQFPYLSMEEVKKKLQDQYGASTGESLKENQGALIWESDKTSIILWVDQYEKKPFCRKITYVGKDIAKELNEYQKEIFSSAELEVLKKLAP